jgi:hypothetical protein
MPDMFSTFLFWLFKKSLRALLRYFSGYPYITSNLLERSILKIVSEFVRYKIEEKDSLNIDARYIEIAHHTMLFVQSEFTDLPRNKKPLGFF